MWAAGPAEKLPPAALQIIEDRSNALFFSAASLWEISIKKGLDRPDFQVDPFSLRSGLLNAGYTEIPVTGQHAAAVSLLPIHHKDPFDRLLLVQAAQEGLMLVTADAQIARYDGPVLQV